jgi:transcriptional regulator GlxA family with amidase domain
VPTLNSMTPVGEHGMRFVADVHFSEAEQADVIFIPGGSGSRIAMEDQAVISYLQEQSKRCQFVMSVCTGSFLMQKAGLFRGRRATTHWAFLDHLKDDPEVEVVEQRFVHDGNIWSSGGVSAGMDMMLAFIAHVLGAEVAADVQLYAEYFPATTIYGRPFERENVSEYIRGLSQHV